MALGPRVTSPAVLRRWFTTAASRGDAAAPPLVLLLGWLGCDPRHLAKYTSIYESSFEATVTPLRPTLLQTASPRLADAAALRYAAALEAAAAERDGTGETPPVLVHVMSNAGWLAFGGLLRLAASSQPPAEQATSVVHLRRTLGQVRGIVIDSAPSEATPSIWARGTVSAALGKPAEGIEAEHPAAVRLAERWAARYLERPQIFARLKQVRTAWAQHAPLAPQLYLYSSADALIPAAHVEAFMAQQAQRGVRVEGRRWEDSGHCEHLRRHPEEYTALVRAFVQRALAESPAPCGRDSESNGNCLT